VRGGERETTSEKRFRIQRAVYNGARPELGRRQR